MSFEDTHWLFTLTPTYSIPFNKIETITTNTVTSTTGSVTTKINSTPYSDLYLNNQFYFQSETSGYSHVHVFDINTRTVKDITPGKYEVQDLALSKNKQNFYLLTNETHPGKLNWYRLKIDGSAKERITAMLARDNSKGGHGSTGE